MDKIIQAERHSASTKVHFAYLTELYKSVELIDKEPEWENCFNIVVDDGIDNHLNVIFDTAAGYLHHHGKVALSIAKMPNSVFIKTNKV